MEGEAPAEPDLKNGSSGDSPSIKKAYPILTLQFNRAKIEFLRGKKKIDSHFQPLLFPSPGSPVTKGVKKSDHIF